MNQPEGFDLHSKCLRMGYFENESFTCEMGPKIYKYAFHRFIKNDLIQS